MVGWQQAKHGVAGWQSWENAFKKDVSVEKAPVGGEGNLLEDTLAPVVASPGWPARVHGYFGQNQ